MAASSPRWPRHGDAQRAHRRRWLEGYILTGRHGSSQQLRVVHPRHRLDVQPARQVAGEVQRAAVAGDVSSLNLLITALVWRQDHNGFTHQDPGFLDVVANKSPTSSASICRPTPTACSRWPTTACAAPTTSTSSSPTSRCISSTSTWKRPSRIAPRASASGTGPATTRAPSPTSSWPAAATCPQWSRWPPPRCSASTCPTSRSGSSTWSTSFRLRAQHRTPARPHGPRVRGAVHRRQAGDLQLPRLPLADPPAHLPPARTSTTSTSAATRRRATSTRRWSWPSATRPTASAWRSTRSTACRASMSPGRALAKPCSISRSHAGIMLTSSVSTRPKSPIGSGRSERTYDDR